MAKIGGVLVDEGSQDVAYLVEYPVKYVYTDDSVEIIIDGDFIPYPNFKRALHEGGRWVCATGALRSGNLHVTVKRCDQTRIIAVDDTSAQLAVTFAWYALISQRWYLPLLEQVVVTGALARVDLIGQCEPIAGELPSQLDVTHDLRIDPIVGGLKSKLGAFGKRRQFCLLVIPDNKNEPQYDERVLRVSSIADLERKLLQVWSRAAFSRLQHPLTILECLLGSWWIVMIAGLAILVSWFLLADPYYLAVPVFVYGGGLLWTRHAMRLESRRMDGDEREQNRHSASDLEDPFPQGGKCPRQGWLEMFEAAHYMVRRESAKRVCRWATERIKKARKLAPQPLSHAPSRAWRGTWSYWLPMAVLIGSVLFVTYSPLRYALAECVPGPADIRQNLHYRANDGWRSALARDSNGVLLVGDHGILDVWIEAKTRAGRRLRVSCAAPSGVEAADNIVPNISSVGQCELDDFGNLCDAKRAGTLVCRIPTDNHLEIGYYLLPSARSARFTMTTELLTHFNAPLAIAREPLRWDPQLGTIASGSFFREGGKQ